MYIGVALYIERVRGNHISTNWNAAHPQLICYRMLAAGECNLIKDTANIFIDHRSYQSLRFWTGGRETELGS